jgi:2-polyprenyl-6-methoxyphenol hydroxylase-like FAD-dependent oxidoreductase
MKVIIVRAGISGLTLAAALAQLAPHHEVEFYERNASAADRRKSNASGLKGDEGLAVPEQLGLRDKVPDADRVAGAIAARGRKAVLESRRAAKQFHATSRFQILTRNLGFRVGNAVINSRLRSRKTAPAEFSAPS